MIEPTLREDGIFEGCHHAARLSHDHLILIVARPGILQDEAYARAETKNINTESETALQQMEDFLDGYRYGFLTEVKWRGIKIPERRWTETWG